MPLPLALLGSPLLGPRPWRELVEAAAHRGRRATVITQPVPPPGAATAAAAYASALPPGETVLVAHSNAGLYVPALSAARPGVRAVIFLDAALVPAGATGAQVAPPALITHLEPLADARGVLPGWTDWFDPEQIAALAPAQVLAEVAAEQPRIPLTYLRDTVDAPAGWERLPIRYVAFGDTYAPELAQARARGWSTEQIAGAGHLHMLADPQEVMTHIETFLDEELT